MAGRLGCAAAAVVAAVLIAGAAAGAAAPKCFGAAARDARRDCENPRLRLTVTPTPDEAAITPNLACVRKQLNEVIDQCAYGTAARAAVESVAFIGDSHASHWRAAMAVVARRKHWRVLEIARPHCPFTQARMDSNEPTSWCVSWNREVSRWLAAHPEVRTVFVSANAQVPIVVPQGGSEWDVRRDGFVAAWQTLPASVQRLVVIRDNPTDRIKTHDCIRRAMARRRPPGRACQVPRRLALPPDAAVAAAHRLRSRGARVVSLTRYFCGRRRCLPVVGGVLVHKDVDHLTQLYARTLGPYLLRAIDALRLHDRG
jgi:SGNH domain (fused to AT3 domains)